MRSTPRPNRGQADLLRSTLGGVLRSWRKKKPRLNQLELSRQAGLPSNAVGDLERGERRINAEELVRLCAALDISVAAFLEEVKMAQIEALRPLEEALQGERDGRRAESASEPNQDKGEEVPDLFFFGLGLSRAGRDPERLVRAMTKLFALSSSPVDPGGER